MCTGAPIHHSEATGCFQRNNAGHGSENVLVWFSVISLGGKGHRDARRRFRLRAEIKAHTREPAAGPGTASFTVLRPG